MATGLQFNRQIMGQAASGAPAANPTLNQGNNNVAPLQRGTRGPRLDAQGHPIPETEIYLNVITRLPMVMEDGTTEIIEVSLPFGLGVDTMNESSNGGPMLNAAKNAFLGLFKQVGQTLAPGHTLTIDQSNFPLDCSLQLRRKGNAVADAGTNPLIAAMQAAITNFGTGTKE